MAAPEQDVLDTMLGLFRQVAQYKNYRNSLGYSFRYYINQMASQQVAGQTGDGTVKVLSIDGVAPTKATIADGSYPLSLEFYAVTAKRDGQYLNPQRTSQTDALLTWIQGPQGQQLVAATGYVPLS
jgi:phosphate transport system substrate-binding protein